MRLLLCEDEKELSNALAKILTYYHYTVDVAYDGEEALCYLESENYDAVILDIMMPKVDGLTVLKEVRQAGNLVPIIMLTAKAQLDDKVTGLDWGANDYLTKPFETKELLARLRVMTRRNIEENISILTVGDVSLNRKTLEMSTEINSIKLTNEEFRIMEMLMIQKGHGILEERFVEKIWGTSSETDIVWVYISYLRKKLEILQAKIRIVGPEDKGYILEEQHV